jgi:hypothetical protein
MSKAFGEQNPTLGEDPVSWQTWSDGAGGIPNVVGNIDWGKLSLQLSGAEGRSAVYDHGSALLRTYTLTENRYGVGSGSADLQIRGDTSIFAQDDVYPYWEDYTIQISRTWRYVQVRENTWAWPYRKKITIDHTKVVGNLADYPLLISLTTDADLANYCQTNGEDILFTSADGTTKLSHQIEKFTVATGLLVAWVKIPAILAANDIDIYMYFGNKTCASQQDPTNVWDAGYAAVYHLNETAGHHLDSTVNAINSTVEVVTGKGTAIGIANGGDDLNGAADCITVSDNILFDGGSGGHLSLELWLNFDTKPSVKVADETLLRKPHSADPWNAWTWYVSSADDKPRFEFPTALGGWRGMTFGTALNASTMYYLAVSRNPDEAVWTRDDGYLNGVWDADEAADDGDVIFASDGALTIGANYSGGSGLDGKIDEIRISTVARSAQYFGTVYANLNSPVTFYTLGGLES